MVMHLCIPLKQGILDQLSNYQLLKEDSVPHVRRLLWRWRFKSRFPDSWFYVVLW